MADFCGRPILDQTPLDLIRCAYQDAQREIGGAIGEFEKAISNVVSWLASITTGEWLAVLSAILRIVGAAILLAGIYGLVVFVFLFVPRITRRLITGRMPTLTQPNLLKAENDRGYVIAVFVVSGFILIPELNRATLLGFLGLAEWLTAVLVWRMPIEWWVGWPDEKEAGSALNVAK
jgi:hypothetical protein